MHSQMGKASGYSFSGLTNSSSTSRDYHESVPPLDLSAHYNSPTMQKNSLLGLTRRELLEALGIGAAAVALPSAALAQGPTFPKGAVIRTLLKDYAPEDLAGGATLFHEHMQLGPDFNQKFSAASAAVRALNPPAPGRGGPGGGGAAGRGGPAGGGGAGRGGPGGPGGGGARG